MPEWWHDARVVSLLAAPGQTSTLALPDGRVAHRVGRNRVWRVESPRQGAHFLKICRDAADFERQTFGLRTAAALAASGPGCLAATVVAEDPARHLLVSTPIEGECLAEIFTDAFRWDRNPWARPAKVRRALDALAAVMRWLRAFHAAPVAAAPAAAYDHTAAGTWRRIAHKLDAIEARSGLPAGQYGWRDRTFTPPAAPVGLVFGDATLGNFFCDGDRVGAVDFEDVGTGDGARDQATLCRIIEMAFAQPHYRRVTAALDVVGRTRTPMHDCVDLELEVDRLEALTRAPGWRSAVPRLQARRRVARGLTALARSGHLHAATPAR